jgi:diacylglycerol kinase family enzyme
MGKKAVLIVNPNAGGRKGLAIGRTVKDILVDGGMEVDVLPTAFSGHATELARTISLVDISVVLCVGGDGTVHEVVNGLLSRDDYAASVKDDVAVCIIPAGSGNTLAYDLGLLSVEGAAKKCLEGRSSLIDVIEVTNVTSENVGEKEVQETSSVLPIRDSRPIYCINIVGYGLPPAVLNTANSMRFCGGAKYDLAIYYEVLLKNTKYNVRITFPEGEDKSLVSDEIREELKKPNAYNFVQGQLTIHMGDKTPLCPKAKLDDGLLDLILAKHGGVLEFTQAMDLAKEGMHLEMDSGRISYLQCSEYTLYPDSSMDSGVAPVGEGSVNIDGELAGASPMRVRCLKQMLRVIR